jgi:hypothetical protein
LGEISRLDLDPFETQRDAEAKLKTATIDAPRLPVPVRIPMYAIGAGEAGHALEGHLVVRPCDVPERI